MSKDLTTSNVARQNILNNTAALNTIRERLGIGGILYDGEFLFTKKMVADFYEIDERTLERCVEDNLEELKHNGYSLCKGKRLKDIKLQFAHVINVGSKTTQLVTFNFRSLLNVGMLLSESEKAKQIRSRILDIVIETINNKAGGNVKYINRRDPAYIASAITESNYRKVFTEAVGQCVAGHRTFKYSQATDCVYKAVFKENAKEYRELLKLDSKDNVHNTLYAEVLLVVASFENGVGYEIQSMFKKMGRQLTMDEVAKIVEDQAENPMMTPFINDARSKMSSRDLALRDIIHVNLEEYLRAVAPEEYDRFIGSNSIDFDYILEANKDVLLRLKMDGNE